MICPDPLPIDLDTPPSEISDASADAAAELLIAAIEPNHDDVTQHQADLDPRAPPDHKA